MKYQLKMLQENLEKLKLQLIIQIKMNMKLILMVKQKKCIHLLL